jgi:hypothetical protein
VVGGIGSLVLNRFIQTSVTFWAVIFAFVFSSLVGVIFVASPRPAKPLNLILSMLSIANDASNDLP